MNIQNLQTNNDQSINNQASTEIKPDDLMVFPDLSVAVVYMMHRYITTLDYAIDTPTRSDAVFSVSDENGNYRAELLFSGKVVEFDGDYEEYITKQEVMDFYANSISVVKACNEKAAADKFNKFLRDAKETIAEGGQASKKAVKTYFILNTSTKLIKIGKSVRPSQRIKDIQGMAGAKLELLAVIDRNIEAELHNQFKQYRRTGEWFEDTDGLIAKCIDVIASEGVA
jgi:hypothetical protein